MAGVEKFACPNVDCGHVDYSEGECPVCGSELVKPKGEAYRFDPKADDDGAVSFVSEADDEGDPSDVSWYSEGSEGYGMM